MTEEERVAKATIRDEKRLKALEAAEKEHSSMADVVRYALDRLADANETEADTNPDAVDVPKQALRGYWELVEWMEVGGRIDLGTAKSVLANKLNIPKAGVLSQVIKPLVDENLLWKRWGHENVWLVVGRRDGEVLNAPEKRPTTTEAETDGGSVSERLDELANAEVER